MYRIKPTAKALAKVELNGHSVSLHYTPFRRWVPELKGDAVVEFCVAGKPEPGAGGYTIEYNCHCLCKAQKNYAQRRAAVLLLS